jgi:hypothetical protein
MIFTLVAVLLGLLSVALLLLISGFWSRERAFEKVVIPPVAEPMWKVETKTVTETQPMMVGLSQQVDEAARKLADDIDYDLYYGADGSNEPQEFIFEPPPAPKKKRKSRAKPKTKNSRVGKARRSGPRAKR